MFSQVKHLQKVYLFLKWSCFLIYFLDGFVLAFLKFLQLYNVMLVIGHALMSNYFLLFQVCSINTCREKIETNESKPLKLYS